MYLNNILTNIDLVQCLIGYRLLSVLGSRNFVHFVLQNYDFAPKYCNYVDYLLNVNIVNFSCFRDLITSWYWMIISISRKKKRKKKNVKDWLKFYMKTFSIGNKYSHILCMLNVDGICFKIELNNKKRQQINNGEKYTIYLQNLI